MNCTFDGNTILRAATIVADASDFEPPQVRLEACTFSNNSPATLPTLLADNRCYKCGAKAVFFSDTSSPPVCSYEESDDILDSTPPQCINSGPLPLVEAEYSFLTANEWFPRAPEVRFRTVAPCT